MATPTVQALTPALSVAPQLEPSAMSWLAQQGFKSVINNRPDFESGPDQPTSAQMEAAATQAGLTYRYLPVPPSSRTPQDVAQFAALLKTLPQPILAFCRSGGRSTRLYEATLSIGAD
jgi:uncharacterized protein (TIGR01244 family)